MWYGVMFLLAFLSFSLFSLPLSVSVTADVEENLVMEDVPDETECPHSDAHPERPLREGGCGLKLREGRTKVGSHEEAIAEVERYAHKSDDNVRPGA